MWDAEFNREVQACKDILEGREPSPGPDTQEPQEPRFLGCRDGEMEILAHFMGETTRFFGQVPVLPAHTLASRRDGWRQSL